jgi:hypothetical protein
MTTLNNNCTQWDISHTSLRKLLHVSAPRHHPQEFRSFLRLMDGLHLIVRICWVVELIMSIMHWMYPLNMKSAKWLLRKLPKSMFQVVWCGFVVLTYKDVSGRTGSWINCSRWKTVKKTWFCVKRKTKILYFKYIGKNSPFTCLTWKVSYHINLLNHILVTWCTNQFNIQQLYVLSTLYLCVLYLSENKQRLVPLPA